MSVDKPQSSERNNLTENNLQDELLYSLLKEDIETFKILLKKVNPNFKYSSQEDATCLEIACMKPNRGLFVKVLLKSVEPTLAGVTSQPIHLAAKHGHFDSLAALVSDPRTDVAARDSEGNTALILICKFITTQRQEEYLQCFECLVPEMSPNDLNIRDNDGLTAFHALLRETRMMLRMWDSKMSMDKCESLEELGTKSQESKEARLKLVQRMVQLFKNDLDIETSVEGRLASEDLEENFPNLKECFFELRELDKTHMKLIHCLKSKRVDKLRDLLNQKKGGYFIYNVNHRFGSPLHTTCLLYACEFGLGAKIIQVLLNAKADPNKVIRPTLKSPIHILCENGHDEELLSMFQSKNPPDINATDRFRNTALHYLLDKPASSKKIQLGRRNCLQILLQQEKLNVNTVNISCITPIMLGIQNKHEKLLKDILKKKNKQINWKLEQDGKSIRIMLQEEFPNLEKNIPQEQVGNSEVDGVISKVDHQGEIDHLFSLLRKGDEKQFAEGLKKRRLLTVCDSSKSHTLLQKAADLGLVDAVTALLDRGANPNNVCKGNKSPPAVIACKYRYYDVLSVFLENRKNGFDVNAADSLGNTALHYAMRTEYAANNIDIVISLLKCGGSLEKNNGLGKPPINEKQLESLLDQCLETNQKNAFEDDYEIIFKYQLIASSNSSYRDEVDEEPMSQLSSLIPIEDENRSTLLLNSNVQLNTEMDFLFKMSKSEELSNLLDHPVCLTFLNQKWNRAKFLVYLNMFLYFVFLLLLNTFIVHCAYPMSHNLRRKMKSDHDYLRKKSRVKRHMISLAAAIIVFWLLTIIREIVQFSINMKKYLLSWENYLELSLLISSLGTVLIPFVSPDYFFQRIFNVTTILLSWSELLVLLGQTSLFAKHIEMLKVVSKNYVLPLLCYCSFVVAFGLSFHTLYIGSPKYNLHSLQDEIQNKTVQEMDEENDFNYWHRSIMKALVMMTGELGFDSFPKGEYFSMVLFLVFVLLETIVLINLLAGIASQGTDQIENASVRLERITRVRVLTRVEMLLVKLHNMSVCGMKLPQWVRRRLSRVVLFAGITKDKREGRLAPNQSLELVFTKDSKLMTTMSTLDRATQIINQRYEIAQEYECTCRKGSFRRSRMSRRRSNNIIRK